MSLIQTARGIWSQPIEILAETSLWANRTTNRLWILCKRPSRQPRTTTSAVEKANESFSDGGACARPPLSSSASGLGSRVYSINWLAWKPRLRSTAPRNWRPESLGTCGLPDPGHASCSQEQNDAGSFSCHPKFD
jgi:hypothetical protein